MAGNHDSAGLGAARVWALIVACLAVGLVIAGMVALYGALPSIATATGASQQQLTWITDSYTLALACLVLPGGALGDRYGRRRMMVAGLLVLAAGSLIPLVVSGPVWLIAARAVTGVGAALVMPSTLSLLTAGFPASRRGLAVGVWAAAVASGGAIGLLGAGVLLMWWSWTAILIAMAGAGLVLAVAACTVAESVEESRVRFDTAGAVVGAVAVGSVVVAASEVPLVGWGDPLVLVLLAVGLGSSALFVAVELRADAPMLDVRLFADRKFGSGAFTITAQFLVVFGVFMLVVQYLQLVLGYGPLGAALAVSPIMVPLVLVSPVAPWLSERIGLRAMMASGLAVTAVGMYGLARLSVHGGYSELVWALVVIGLGIALSATPATAAIVGAVPAHKHGVAAAVNDATREVGAAIGIAVVGSLLAAGYRERIEPVVAALPLELRAPVVASPAAALAAAEAIGPAARPLVERIEEAFVHGSGAAAMVLAAGVLAAAAVVVFWAPGRVRLAAADVEAGPQTSELASDVAPVHVTGKAIEINP
ncbi:MFS transporter [Nocardia alba]|uniref:EmrB/QacA subfamily drug resistance transporter n=1 Tax=Nocardia alba TaxID=225051 RepID=A0A4R1FS43_9NOCA|nr:MFS transporter [Nocardia alba]TCJ97653.1 EmrB/QacA subfamily drug resistance transporter [Nocardia alba]